MQMDKLNIMLVPILIILCTLSWTSLSFAEENGQNAGIGDEAWDNGSNQWDDGSKGNYYSKIQCNDSDANGICDSSHAISGGKNIDRYPLAY